VSAEQEILAAHRSFYDAIETADLELMESLWMDDPRVSCVHPAARPVFGADHVLRSWAMLMAQIEYIQFFLTDVKVTVFPDEAEQPVAALVVCLENILSDGDSEESFTGGSVVCSSLLVPDRGAWRFWSRHASPIALVDPSEDES